MKDVWKIKAYGKLKCIEIDELPFKGIFLKEINVLFRTDEERAIYFVRFA